MASSRAVSQKFTVNGRRGNALCSSRSSGAVFDRATASGGGNGHGLALPARRVDANNVPSESNHLQHPDHARSGIDLPAAKPVAIGGGKGVVVVMPSLAPGGNRKPGQVPGFIARLPVPRAVRALVVAVYVAPILTIGITLVPVQWSVVSFVVLGGVLAREVFASRGQPLFARQEVREYRDSQT